MGTASYGSIVARLLDPTGKLFFDRIVTRDHTKGISWSYSVFVLPFVSFSNFTYLLNTYLHLKIKIATEN